jgi:lysozyme
MKGQTGGAMAEGKTINARKIAIGIALLLALFVLWRVISGWAPSRADYPMQGVVVDESHGKPFWPSLAATGVDFAYLTATMGDKKRDAEFATNLAAVREAGIRFGALHRFDICRLATDQATSFITTVPRYDNALPPAVELSFSSTCTGRPDRALILSELATFLSQIEAHSGSPAVLMISDDFEEQYKVTGSIDRNVWLERTWLLPDYAAKPWVMWTANPRRRIDGLNGSVRWAVVRNK